MRARMQIFQFKTRMLPNVITAAHTTEKYAKVNRRHIFKYDSVRVNFSQIINWANDLDNINLLIIHL